MARAEPASPWLGRRWLLQEMGLHPAQKSLKWHFWKGGGLRVPACCTVLPPRLLAARHAGGCSATGAGILDPLIQTLLGQAHSEPVITQGHSLSGLDLSHLTGRQPQPRMRTGALQQCNRSPRSPGRLVSRTRCAPGVQAAAIHPPPPFPPRVMFLQCQQRWQCPPGKQSWEPHLEQADSKRDHGSGGGCLLTEAGFVSPPVISLGYFSRIRKEGNKGKQQKSSSQEKLEVQVIPGRSSKNCLH